MLLAELVELAETTAATVRKLEDRGLVEITSEISERDPYARETILPTQPIVLNPAQSVALEKIKTAMKNRQKAEGRRCQGGAKPSLNLQPSTLNLQLQPFCCTASPAAARRKFICRPSRTRWSRAKARSCSCRKFRSRRRRSSGSRRGSVRENCRRSSPCCIRILSAGERHDEWHKIRQGRARIVIGARSAIFAPVEPLGLIIVDEEHEHDLQAGGSAALPRARRGRHARPDGKCRRRARLGHAVAGKFLQLQTRQIHAARIAGARGRPKNAARPRRGHAAGGARRKRARRFFRRNSRRRFTQRLERRRADDFISEPARLLDFAAMPEVRLRLRMPELQHRAHVPSRRNKNSPATSAATSKKFRRFARTKNAKIRRSVMPAPARKKSRKRSPNFFPRRASSAWTPTR